MKLKSLLASILIVTFGCTLYSCHSGSSNSSNSVDTTNISLSDTDLIQAKIQSWDKLMNQQMVKGLDSIYANTILIYGKKISLAQLIKDKKAFFDKNLDYNQVIGNVLLIPQGNNEYKATFNKTFTISGKTSSVNAYLVFSKSSSGWKITTESDETTDSNLTIKPSLKNDTCESLIIDIVKSAPYFKNLSKGITEAIIKNGGSGYGFTFEASPKDKAHPSNVYELNVHESYSDRYTVIDRFTFDPNNNNLYRYDVVNDSLIQIDYDINSLNNFTSNCK